MKIVLDTCVLYHHRAPPLLDSPEFDALDSASRNAKLRIVIPQLVLDELINTVKRDLKRALIKSEEAINRAAGLLINRNALTRPALSIEKAVSDYRNTLLRRVQELDAETPDYRDIEHGDLIVRCALKRKPFTQSDKSDKGYKDSLIWETLLRKVACSEKLTVFVSENLADFADPENHEKLHPDLLEDLRDRNLPQTAVAFAASLPDCVQKYVVPLLKKIADSGKPDLEGLLDQFNESIPTFLDENIDEVQSRIRDVLEDRYEELCHIVGYDVYGVYSVYLQTKLEPPKPESGSLIEDDRSFISYYLQVETTIELFLNKSDACNLSSETTPTLYEFDWNETLSLVGVDMTLEFTLDVVADLRTGKVIKWSIPHTDVALPERLSE